MSDDMIALSRRAVACKGWRWMAGMRARGPGDSGVVTNVWSDPDTHHTTDIFVSYDEECRSCEHVAPDFDQCLPDLTDPATLGCLVALVREAYADQCACVFSIDYGPAGVMWQVRLTANGRQVTARHYATEAEALVAALEAAP